jgi:hypothetical protein
MGAKQILTQLEAFTLLYIITEAKSKSPCLGG